VAGKDDNLILDADEIIDTEEIVETVERLEPTPPIEGEGGLDLAALKGSRGRLGNGRRNSPRG